MATRRRFIKKSAFATLGLMTAGSMIGATVLHTQDISIETHARELHKRILTLDSHCNTPLQLLSPQFDIGTRNNTHENGSRLDFPRMKEGGLNASFFAVYLKQGARSTKGYAKAKKKTLHALNNIRGSMKANRKLAQTAFKSQDAALIAQTGKRAIYMGIENGWTIGKDISLLEDYYQRGARYITLCNSGNNDICDSSTDKKGSEFNGISAFGEKVIKEMNRLGMMVDVSHASDYSFYDAVRLSKTPVIASHSCARALCKHPRNLDDNMLRELAQNGGVIQVGLFSDYVKLPLPDAARYATFKSLQKKYKNKQPTENEQVEIQEVWQKFNKEHRRKLATVSDMVNHIDHIVAVAGIDHVGIGTDFDGGGGLADCYDSSELSNITLELLKRGYSEEAIRKIWSGNFMRVFTEVERYKTASFQ